MKGHVWTVLHKDEATRLNTSDLLELLLGKLLKKTEDEHAMALSREFLTFLQSRSALDDMSFVQLIYMSFFVGYYYRLFLEKNEVKLDTAANGNESSST